MRPLLPGLALTGTLPYKRAEFVRGSSCVNHTTSSPPDEVPSRKERLLVLLLCALAALRTLVFCAAFPPFNNVDEHAHLDLVVKYSRGHVPRGLEPISTEAGRCLVTYGTLEYVMTPDQFPNGQFPPPLWTLPPEQAAAVLQVGLARWQSATNHESSEPPLYYALAGAWLAAGRAAGLPDGLIPCWIRFPNALVAAALVWLGFVAARLVSPGRRFLRLGLPALLAVFPQDTFYSIQSDALSPVFFGITFIGLVKLLQTDTPGRRLAAVTGLALAATCLVKTANLPLLAVAGATVLIRAWQLSRRDRLRMALPGLMWLAVCAAAPVGIWFAWNLNALGDATGTAAKIQFLGWTRKPVADWLPHPIFTPSGFFEFWSDLMATFWCGEIVWHRRRLAWPAADAFYWASSALLLALAAAGWFRKRPASDRTSLPALALAFASFVVLVAFLVFLSVAFDFGSCFYPSRARPFFTSGRLLDGALIPFLLLYVRGLDQALGRRENERARWLALAGIVVAMALSELLINRPVFSSPFNLFHFLS